MSHSNFYLKTTLSFGIRICVSIKQDSLKDLLYLSFVQKSSLVNLEIRRPRLLFYYTTSSSCLCPVPSVFLWLCFAGTHRGSSCSSSNPKADNLACHPSEILAILQLLHYSLHCSTQALQPYIGPAQ